MTEQTDPILQALNPGDYFTLAMDEEIRQEQMPGSWCGYTLILNRAPDIAALSTRIQAFTQQYPLAIASLQQRGAHFYWCQRANAPDIFFQHPCPGTELADSPIENTLFTLLNENVPRAEQLPLSFHLISTSTEWVLLMRWTHSLCDAKGADLILQHLCSTEARSPRPNPQEESTALITTQLAKYSWWHKIKLFVNAKLYIGRLDRLHSIQPAPQQLPPKRLIGQTHTFSVEQTTRILKHARSQVGLTGTSLYYLGCLMRALQQLGPDHPGDGYCIPYAFNLRKQNARTPLFGNHIGALFAQAPKSVLNERPALFGHLKQQATETVRRELDYAFLPVMWAARWLPLKKYGAELRISHSDGSERSSAWFSDIGQPQFAADGFFGADVTGLRHFCQISSPPGLALIVCLYRQQLTLSFNAMAPLFSAEWLAQLQETLQRELLDT